MTVDTLTTWLENEGSFVSDVSVTDRHEDCDWVINTKLSRPVGDLYVSIYQYNSDSFMVQSFLGLDEEEVDVIEGTDFNVVADILMAMDSEYDAWISSDDGDPQQIVVQRRLYTEDLTRQMFMDSLMSLSNNVLYVQKVLESYLDMNTPSSIQR